MTEYRQFADRIPSDFDNIDPAQLDFLKAVQQMTTAYVETAYGVEECFSLIDITKDIVKKPIEEKKDIQGDILLDALGVIGIIGENSYVPKFSPFNESITQIGVKGPLFFRDEKIQVFSFPEIGGEGMSSRLLNNLNVMTKNGVSGDPVNDHIILGVRSIIEGSDAIVFFFSTKDSEYQVLWDDMQIVVAPRDLEKPLWLRKKQHCYYNYSCFLGNRNIFGFPFYDVKIEYPSKQHFDRNCDLLVDVDGISYSVPLERIVLLQNDSGVYYDSAFNRVEVLNGAGKKNGVYEALIKMEGYYIRNERIGAKVYSPQQIQFVIANLVVVNDLFSRLFVVEKRVREIDVVTCRVVMNSQKAKITNESDIKAVYSATLSTRSMSRLLDKGKLIGLYNFEREFHSYVMYYGKVCRDFDSLYRVYCFPEFSLSKTWFPGAVGYCSFNSSYYDHHFYLCLEKGFSFYNVKFKRKLDRSEYKIEGCRILRGCLDRYYVVGTVSGIEEFLKRFSDNEPIVIELI